MIVPVKVESPRAAGPPIDSYLGYLEPEMRDSMGLVVVRSVAPVKDECTVARLRNPTDKELTLHPSSHLGVFYQVDECDLLTPAEVFGPQQVDVSLLDVTDCSVTDEQREQLLALLVFRTG